MFTKQELLEAKDKIIAKVLERIEQGEYNLELYNIITARLSEIKFEETEEERKQRSKELSETLVKSLSL
ncbi:MAG: hypothetical protein IJ371_02885 [Clostridia bacterium]|nr:hypothetical protein [Clostridia bacterium]